MIEGTRGGLEASGKGRPGTSRRCPRGRAPESGLASCLSPKCLEISIEYDSEDEQEAGSGGISITSSCCPADGEPWGTDPVERPRGPPKVNSGPNPYPHLPAWEKGEPERRGRSATCRAKEPPSRVCAHFLPRAAPHLLPPAAAWWPCLLPTSHSHSTLPPPSAASSSASSTHIPPLCCFC